MSVNDTFDFGDGLGAVPAHRHPNGGGWVADSARVEGSAYVADSAIVKGSARVEGSARVWGSARVGGSASYASGRVLKYDWTAYADVECGIRLRFGCECHPLADWPDRIEPLSRKHEPKDAERYIDALHAIVDLVCLTVDPCEVTP